jgi:hypothetical protein
MNDLNVYINLCVKNGECKYSYASYMDFWCNHKKPIKDYGFVLDKNIVNWCLENKWKCKKGTV